MMEPSFLPWGSREQGFRSKTSQQKAASSLWRIHADKQLPLLGRDLLCNLRLDWSKMLRSNKADSSRIHAIHSVNLLNEFPDVMDETLGLLKGTKAEIQLKEGTVPVFCKYRPVPFALREQVEEMIRQQVIEGELEPVESSDWAAPIVIARKKDSNTRICADFKMNINPLSVTYCGRNVLHLSSRGILLKDRSGSSV